MAFDAIVVDLDGTVWDSFPWYASVIGDLTGKDQEMILAELMSGGNLIQLIAKASLGRQRFFRECEKQANTLELFPNVEETIRDCVDSNVPLGVFTSLPYSLARAMCDAKNLSDAFTAFEAAKRGRRPKPNPQGIFDVLRIMDVDPTSSVCYVGDLPVDAIAAHAAGVSFAWARYGYGELTNEPRVAELDSFSDISSL